MDSIVLQADVERRNSSSYLSVGRIIEILGLSLFVGLMIFFVQDNLTLGDVLSPPSAAKTKKYQVISLADAIQLFYNPETIILDVREKVFYDYGHIERSINFPAEQISTINLAFLDELKKAPSIMVYCNGTSCGAAGSVASFLTIRGVSNVNVYSGGWPEWEKCHLPVKKTAIVLKAANEK